MINHTPEPWRVEDKGLEIRIVSDNGNYPPVVSAGSDEGDSPYLDIDDADASRIVACVNACEGISTEELETLCRGQLVPMDALVLYGPWRCTKCNYATQEHRQGPHWFDEDLLRVVFL